MLAQHRCGFELRSDTRCAQDAPLLVQEVDFATAAILGQGFSQAPSSG
jgi:hypothetical protein